MSILTSIEIARSAGIKDDAILNQIMTQNSKKASIFQQAIDRGASASDIVNEIIKQNQPTGIDRMIEQKNTAKEQPEEEKKGGSLLGKVGRFFTGATQKFSETLGTAASVIDPKTKKMREETISSSQSQADKYLEMAKNETDKDKKDEYLKAASYLADTEGIDIFNNPEYQKTAKQVYGEAIGVAAETLGWGKVGNIAKTVKASTVAQTALKSAKTGAAMGGVISAAGAMEEGKSGSDILKSAAIGTVTGAALGRATGAIAGKVAGKISQKQAIKLVSPKLTAAEKEIAIKQGRLKGRTLLKSEKYIPSKKDKELGKLAQEIGLRGDDASKDAVRANSVIETEANKLKAKLKATGGIYNRNTIKGQLNKMKVDKTADLTDGELRPYNNYIAKFNKMADNKKNKGLDGLLELRQEFDAWAKSNNPNIFENKRGGAYRALTAIRDTINDYINKQVGDDIVKESLKKQSNLYTIVENIAEKAAVGGKLQPSKLKVATKKVLPWAGGAIGLEILRKTLGKSASGNSITSYTSE